MKQYQATHHATGVFDVTPIPCGQPRWWTISWLVFVGIVVACLLSGCGLPDDVKSDVLRAQEGCDAIVLDPYTSVVEKETAQACSDALWSILYGTGEVDELPPAVRSRYEARREAARKGE